MVKCDTRVSAQLTGLVNMFEEIDFILASNSPRRRSLLSQMGIVYRTAEAECDEVCPTGLVRDNIPLYLSKLKSESCKINLNKNSLLITADTVVCLGDKTLGKPMDAKEAYNMLKMISGKTHDVITGITLRDITHQKSFYSTTEVTISELSEKEIDYYIKNYKPFDKAGAYGIQEWIGMVGVSRINGCFYNVMGLPTPLLYEEIKQWEFLIDQK